MKRAAKFEDLFHESLANLYDAEKQIAAATPKLIAAASSEELSGALAEHLQETRKQVARLETIFEEIAQEPGGRTCPGMQALLDEAARAIEELEKSPALDIALIAAARKVEHYEIAAYSAVCGLAEILGMQAAFGMLEETLDEETAADEGLEELSEAILSGDTVELEEESEDEEVG